MKKLFLLVGLVVLLSPLVQAGELVRMQEYDGEWRNVSSKGCRDFDSNNAYIVPNAILTIRNNKVEYRIISHIPRNNMTSTTEYRGKVTKYKVGLNGSSVYAMANANKFF
jgi:hypothetical protein